MFYFFLGGNQQYCKILTQAYPYAIKSCKNSVQLINDESISYFSYPKFFSIKLMMNHPDLFHHFYYDYQYYNSEERKDAGRIRLYPLFRQAYGKNKRKVRKNLTKINFQGKMIYFNSKNGAAKSLLEVDQEITFLLQKKPSLKKFFKGPIETFYYRNIAGTKLLSAHSFGIAIDFGIKYSQYWRWNKNWQKTKKINFPLEIVQIFQRHGFIWGGSWEHYDSMHFEYRPEFLKLKKFKGENH